MTAETRRIAVIVPPANVAVEDEYRHYLPADVQMHVARLYRRTYDLNTDTLAELVQSTEAAAKQVAHVEPEVVLWACTSGSFLEGPGADVALAARITEFAAAPAITTSTALRHALAAVGARRVYLATPYIDEINAREVRFFEAAGLEVTHTASFRFPDTRQIRATPSAAVADLVLAEREKADDFDAVFISCTALHAMDRIEELETALGVPVVCSNSATLWAGLRHIGHPTRGLGLGRLFETEA
ncbi:MAG: maleate cis-trans isomerase [Alphaproteobacteria bacterium]|jgi:maleate isomerase|nr:maleate cis-trans isomerase [Alphaproteobacteria bacterium]